MMGRVRNGKRLDRGGGEGGGIQRVTISRLIFTDESK